MTEVLKEDIDWLEHHGVKGMHWGIRNDRGHEGERARTRKIAKLDKKFENQSGMHVWISVNNRMADLSNGPDGYIAKINSKTEYKKAKRLINDYGEGIGPVGRKYVKEQQAAQLTALKQAAKELGTNASGTKEFHIVTNPSDPWTWGVSIRDIKHDDLNGIPDLWIDLEHDDRGMITKVIPRVSIMTHSDLIEAGVDFLEHFGVKGMHWGIRNDRTPGVSRSTDRMARKDAKEHATAKLFYGEGAGNRRKLIKATVEQRMKDPAYKRAFEAHSSRQDLADRASAATKERHRTDRKVKTKQRAGFVARRLTGEMGTQAAFTAATLAGVAFVNSPKGRSMMNQGYSTVRNTYKSKRMVHDISKFLNSQR